MRGRGRWAAAASLLMLAGCTHAPSVLATDDAQADGKMFAAKPGMGRLYLVHGDVASGPTDATSGAVGGAAGAGGGPLMIGLAVIVGSALSSREPPKPAPNPIAGTYYLDGRPLAAMGKGQYMVLDLPPGTYEVRFIHGSIYRPPEARLTLEVEEGKIRFEKSIFHQQSWAASFAGCEPAECQERVAGGQRIAVEWPPAQPPSAARSASPANSKN